MQTESRIKYWFKKTFPYAALLLVTVLLMIYFKQNKSLESYVIEGKSNLINYYTENLKPLFFKTEITNEDVFNFALHKNIPVDKVKNDILQINNEDEKGNSFEIKPGVWKEGTKNFDKYVNYLKLNNNEVSRLDSILTLYKDDLYTSILLDDSNTIAVSPNIYHLQKAIYADIFQFTEALEDQKAGIIASKGSAKSNYNKVVSAYEEMHPNNFIVFAKDTIFESDCEYDQVKLKERLWEAKGNLAELKNELKNIDFKEKYKVAALPAEDVKRLKEKLVYEINSNVKKAYVPHTFTSSINIPDLGKIRFKIDGKDSKIDEDGIEVKTDSLLNNLVISISGSIDNALSSNFNFDFNIDEIDEITNESLTFLESSDLEDWSKFGLKVDSLAKSFEFYYSDTSDNFDYSQFKMDLKKFKKALKKEKRKIESEIKSDVDY